MGCDHHNSSADRVAARGGSAIARRRARRAAATVMVMVALAAAALLLTSTTAAPMRGWMTWERYTCETDCVTFPETCVSEHLIRTTADAPDGSPRAAQDVFAQGVAKPERVVEVVFEGRHGRPPVALWYPLGDSTRPRAIQYMVVYLLLGITF